MSSSLQIRKKRDGTVAIQGDLPDEHTFSSRWIARELGGLVTVKLTVHTTDGDEEYDLEGFDYHLDADGKPVVDDDGTDRANFTGWRARRTAAAKSKKTKAEG